MDDIEDIDDMDISVSICAGGSLWVDGGEGNGTCGWDCKCDDSGIGTGD